MSIEVTVRDTKTGESETTTIWNDYVIVCAGDAYVAHINRHRNGTHVLTVKHDDQANS